MDINGSYGFAAAPDAVWAILTDPTVIAGCLPGCSGLESIGDERYRASLTLAVGAVSGSYTGTVSMLEQRPPHSYRLVVEGSGKGGFVKGEATVELIGDGAGATTVRITGRGEVGGLVARVGQRLLGSVSKMMMDRFFACLQARI
jgi:carbon monoxide dehydrogenase subunit G